VPNLSTALLFRRDHHAQRAFTQQAHYLFDQPDAEDWYNSAKRTFECTKPMTVAYLYSLLRTHGTALFEEYVETTYDLARSFAAQLRADTRFELACAPESNIVCYRYRDGDDAFNKALQHALLEEGQFYIVGTTLGGRYWLRSTLMNPYTTADDLHALRERLSTMAERIRTGATADSGLPPVPQG
jgi:L-2,4-diaminobutyrate decarboxylase